MDKSQFKLVKLKFFKWIFIEFTGKNTLITRLLLLLPGVSDFLLCLIHLSEHSFYPSNLTLALLHSLALQALAHSPCLAHTFLFEMSSVCSQAYFCFCQFCIPGASVIQHRCSVTFVELKTSRKLFLFSR